VVATHIAASGIILNADFRLRKQANETGGEAHILTSKSEKNTNLTQQSENAEGGEGWSHLSNRERLQLRRKRKRERKTTTSTQPDSTFVDDIVRRCRQSMHHCSGGSGGRQYSHVTQNFFEACQRWQVDCEKKGNLECENQFGRIITGEGIYMAVYQWAAAQMLSEQWENRISGIVLLEEMGRALLADKDYSSTTDFSSM
tara:strand:+ start:539 stop:1138 length:600 start_codon:yes stop_codon:yes gene_type:complete